MAPENKADCSGPSRRLSNRNALIIKIALFLNYLSKDNYQRLVIDLQQQKFNPELDILKFMLAKNYVSQGDIQNLKKICVSFAMAQEDTRFGSLCIDFGFLAQASLNLALEEQKKLARQGHNIILGDLLVDAGMISEKHRSLVLQKQKLENISRKNPSPNDSAGTTDGNEAATAPAVLDTSRMQEIRETGIIFLVQNDASNAFAIKTEEFDRSTLSIDVKLLLEKNGIIYGIVDDECLETFIKDDRYTKTHFKIAQGLDPVDGTDARIVFMFDRDYLKPGQLSENGTIDFKERGEIPFVMAGDILAEKILLREGKDGINIFGDAVPGKAAMDISFVLGKNVHLSGDGLRVLADVSGNPKVTHNDEISVNDAYFIEGDVDFTTGHVKFDKNVYITGTIKSGFRVEAIDVVARAMDGGIVKAGGDVFIQNGVTDSVIEAKGNIKAGFIHRSKAACRGDMTIVKEVVDTKAFVEGTFEMNRGKVISSSISAKGGARIYHIGSEKAVPSTITLGISTYLEKELQNIDALIERRQSFLEKKTQDKIKIESTLGMITEKLESLGGADEKIHPLKAERTFLEARLKKTDNDIAASAQAVKISIRDKFALKELNLANPPKPILEVAGKVLAGTKIYSRYASLTLSRDLNRSRIMEINNRSDEDFQKGWELVITNL